MDRSKRTVCITGRQYGKTYLQGLLAKIEALEKDLAQSEHMRKALLRGHPGVLEYLHAKLKEIDAKLGRKYFNEKD